MTADAPIKEWIMAYWRIWQTGPVNDDGCPTKPHHGVDCPGDACRYAQRD